MDKILEKSNQERIRSLAEQIKLNHVIPYIGAGMSMPPFCSWGEYIKRISLPIALGGIASLEEEGTPNYEEQAQFLYDRYPIRFVEETQKTFDTKQIKMDCLNDGVKLLPKLFRGPMITTNLDQVLETVYENSGIKLKIALAGETGFVQKSTWEHTPFLWKIHGDIEKDDTWVLTKNQYYGQYQYPEEKNAYKKGIVSFQSLMSTFLQHHRLLFLGCSLRQDRITSVLKNLFQTNRQIRHYAILPLPEPEEFADYASRLENEGIQAIWYENLDKSHREVTQILQETLRLLPIQYTDNFNVPAVQGIIELDDIKKNASN